MRHKILAMASALTLTCAASGASAALVIFDGVQSSMFVDGIFSKNLSGLYDDGFGAVGLTAARNSYGRNGQYIRFNGPVTLSSLYLGKCNGCYDSHPTTFTVNLYNVSAVLIGSQTMFASSTEQLLTFNKSEVAKVEFTFAGTDGTDPYNDGREVAWYQVRDISYFLNAVPEPATWALMISGFGMVGSALRRRRLAA